MVVETDAVEHLHVHSLLMLLTGWTAVSVPSSLVLGRYLAVRPVEARSRQR